MERNPIMRLIRLFYMRDPDILRSVAGVQEPWPQVLSGAVHDPNVHQRQWGDPKTVPNTNLSESPSAVVLGTFIYVFHKARGRNSGLWYNRSNGVDWWGDTQISGIGLTGSPSAVVFQNQIHVFYQGQGASGKLYHSVFRSKDATDATNPTGELEMVGSEEEIDNVGISNSPGAIVYNGNIWVFHHGQNNNNELWYSVYGASGSSWSSDIKVDGCSISSSPRPVIYDGSLYVYYLVDTAYPDPLRIDYMNFFESEWSGPTTVSVTPTVACEPTVIEKDGQVYLFYFGGPANTDLWYNVLYSNDNINRPVDGIRLMNSPCAVLFPAE
ncbi:MAG: hypothetical protein WCS75_05120 [Sphingomonas sp.]|jgi:hypothetical protein